MMIGFIWYLPPVFGNVWMKALGKRMEELGNPQTSLYTALAMNVVSAVVLAMVFKMLGIETLFAGLHVAFILALGLIVSNQLMRDGFHGVPRKVSLINGANTVVIYLAMGAALVLVG
jgi:phosphate/sulfate permease